MAAPIALRFDHTEVSYPPLSVFIRVIRVQNETSRTSATSSKSKDGQYRLARLVSEIRQYLAARIPGQPDCRPADAGTACRVAALRRPGCAARPVRSSRR